MSIYCVGQVQWLDVVKQIYVVQSGLRTICRSYLKTGLARPDKTRLSVVHD